MIFLLCLCVFVWVGVRPICVYACVCVWCVGVSLCFVSLWVGIWCRYGCVYSGSQWVYNMKLRLHWDFYFSRSSKWSRSWLFRRRLEQHDDQERMSANSEMRSVEQVSDDRRIVQQLEKSEVRSSFYSSTKNSSKQIWWRYFYFYFYFYYFCMLITLIY